MSQGVRLSTDLGFLRVGTAIPMLRAGLRAFHSQVRGQRVSGSSGSHPASALRHAPLKSPLHDYNPGQETRGVGWKQAGYCHGHKE